MKGIIHSGGAAGADATFAKVGAEAGFVVYNHSFLGHNVEAQGIRIDHSVAELSRADPFLVAANQKLQRRYPPVSNFVRKLLQRNYYQIVDAEFVVAVAPLVSDLVGGGTGWAVEIARQLNKPVFLYDTKSNQVFCAADGLPFSLFTGEVPNFGRFAGIGTREITPEGIAFVENLLRR